MSDVSDTSSSTAEVSQLKAEIAELQSQAHLLRVVLLFVMASLCLYFWREAGFNGMAAQQMQPQVMQASQYIEALNKQGSSMEKQMQAIQSAVSRLVDYGRAHSDYVPLLTKYGIPVTPASAATSPATSTAAPKTNR
ncbi:MAG TPA: hypothetical protein VFZ59_24235 [Verrucomicrobiae bacterium]|nr:hypothetical protein [Verrucomicrobiae bacterium]